MGERAFTYAAIARGLRDLGNQQSPFDAFQTLPQRMYVHCENAMGVAEFLAGHPEVAWVTYPGLKGLADITADLDQAIDRAT